MYVGERSALKSVNYIPCNMMILPRLRAIHLYYHFSQIKPTITTLDSTDHPVWEIDFPGVTICPANKVVEKKLNHVYETQM